MCVNGSTALQSCILQCLEVDREVHLDFRIGNGIYIGLLRSVFLGGVGPFIKYYLYSKNYR